MKKMIAVALVSLLALSAAPTFAVDAGLAARVASAKTAADHDAIANAYAKEAIEAEANAALYDKMAASYKALGKIGAVHEAHCAAIAKRERETVKDLNALASAHRIAAKTAK